MNPETINSEQNVDDLTLEDVNMNPSTISEPSSSPGSDPNLPVEPAADPPAVDPAADPPPADNIPGTSTDPGASDTPGDSTPGVPAVATTPAVQPEPVADELSEAEAFSALSEETGVQVTTDDDIVQALIELSSLRQSDKPSNLSPAIQEAIKVEQGGGNLAEHFARTGMDFDKMDGMDVLRQQFFKTEALLFNNNPKFAQMKFERTFNQKYGNWIEYQRLTNDEDKSDFAEEHGGMDNINYDKMMLESDTAMAKTEMNEWKKTAAPEVKSVPTDMTPDQERIYTEQYGARVKKSWEGFNSLSVQMGEGLEDFSLGLNDTTRPQVEGWINNPGTFLRDIGFDKQNIDTDRLLPIMTAIAELSNGTFGSRIAKYVVDTDNIETFRRIIEKPPITPPSATPERGQKDDWELVAEAAEKARIEQTGR